MGVSTSTPDDMGWSSSTGQVWAGTIRSALGAMGKSQIWLARELHRPYTSVAAWCRGDRPPKDVLMVSRMEKALGLTPGELTQHLGYMPIEGSIKDRPNAQQAIAADPDLTPEQKEALVAIVDRWRVMNAAQAQRWRTTAFGRG